jgi:hypothetical protein
MSRMTDAKLSDAEQIGRMIGDSKIKALLFAHPARYLVHRPVAEDIKAMDGAVRPVLQKARWPPELIGLVSGYAATARPFPAQPCGPAVVKRLAAELKTDWIDRARALHSAIATVRVDKLDSCGVLIGPYPGTRLEQLVWKVFISMPLPSSTVEPDAGTEAEVAVQLHEVVFRIPPSYPFKEPGIEFETPMDDPAFQKPRTIDADPLPPPWSPATSLLQLAANLRHALIQSQTKKAATAAATALPPKA